MRKLVLCANLFGMMSLAGCDSPIQPKVPSRPVFAVVENTTLPVAYVVVNPCTGEPVTFTGQLHTKFSENLDGSGGTHSTLHFQTTNFKGTAVTLTGNVNYVAQNGFTLVVNDPGNPAFESTQIVSDRMVRQGEDPAFTDDDFMMHMVVHTTVNANGVPTSDFLQSNVECR